MENIYSNTTSDIVFKKMLKAYISWKKMEIFCCVVAYFARLVYNNSMVKLVVRASSHAFGVRASTER